MSKQIKIKVNPVTGKAIIYLPVTNKVKNITFEDLDEWYFLEDGNNEIRLHYLHDEQFSLSAYVNKISDKDFDYSNSIEDVEIVYNDSKLFFA